MSKLMDIKGYWNMSGYEFNDNCMWEGKILLEEDGWFEGIVKDPMSFYVGDRMVFGVYYPTKVIELLKLAPADVSAPLIFRGKRDAKGYEGEFSEIALFGEIPCGISHIITQDVEYLKENNFIEVSERNIESEKKDILKRISIFKENNEFKELYSNTLAMRKTMTKSVLKNYEGKSLTSEEFEKLKEEFVPVIERVIQATEEEVKRLVKKMPKKTFSEEDDLPF